MPLTTMTATPDIEHARRLMIEQQIRPWDVLDPSVLQALVQVRREDFVPEAYRSLAFVDTEIPLGHGEFMFAPKLEARVLQELDLDPDDEVLEIGTGSGYLAALMASQVQSVTTIERRSDLAEQAQQRLAQAGLNNVNVQLGDGLAHDERWANRLFDLVVITGGVHDVPESLMARVRPEGRLLAFVGEPPIQSAVLMEHRSRSWVSTRLFETLVPALVQSQPRARFQF